MVRIMAIFDPGARPLIADIGQRNASTPPGPKGCTESGPAARKTFVSAPIPHRQVEWLRRRAG